MKETTETKLPMEELLAGPGSREPLNPINYSVELLRRDAGDRTHIRRELSRIVSEYNIRNCRVFEAGCGLGDNLVEFMGGNKLVGIEGLPDAVASARLRGLDVREGDLRAGIALETNSIDWALCLDVLEHLEHPMQLMEEVHRILRVGGRVVINIPNHFNLAGRIRLLMGGDLDVHNFFPHAHEWDNPHLRFFTHAGIYRLLRTAGFDIIDDRSGRFWAFPKQSILEALRLQRLLHFLARLRPSLFAGGFFLIAEKRA